MEKVRHMHGQLPAFDFLNHHLTSLHPHLTARHSFALEILLFTSHESRRLSPSYFRFFLPQVPSTIDYFVLQYKLLTRVASHPYSLTVVRSSPKTHIDRGRQAKPKSKRAVRLGTTLPLATESQCARNRHPAVFASTSPLHHHHSSVSINFSSNIIQTFHSISHPCCTAHLIEAVSPIHSHLRSSARARPVNFYRIPSVARTNALS